MKIVSWLKDIGTYIICVVTHVSAYVTGGIVAAGIFIYEHWVGHNISFDSLVGFLIATWLTGCFMAWRDKHKSFLLTSPMTPIEKRDTADALIAEGHTIAIKWCKKHKAKPKGVRAWKAKASLFVKSQFPIATYDEYEGTIMGAASAFNMAMSVDTEAYHSDAYEIIRDLATKVEALEHVRESIN